jgi:F0F1-type ATP synthase assembly protein I
MKLLPTTPRASTSDDTFGRGMDMALSLLLFFGIGFALDRWLGTTPWFMVGLTVLASVGFFVSFKYRYTARMEQLEAERSVRAAGRPDREVPR